MSSFKEDPRAGFAPQLAKGATQVEFLCSDVGWIPTHPEFPDLWMDVETWCCFLGNVGCALSTQCRVGSHTCARSPGSSGLLRSLFPGPSHSSWISGEIHSAGNPRQKSISPRASPQSQGGAEWIGELLPGRNYWLTALETIPVIPNAKSHREIAEISLTTLLHFPPPCSLSWFFQSEHIPTPSSCNIQESPVRLFSLGKAQFWSWHSFFT